MISDISDISDIGDIINYRIIKEWRKLLWVTTKLKRVLMNYTEMSIY